MTILLLILVALCCYGAWEYHGHQKRILRIPIRIHVNGSRGKSSVTRLIAAGLRAGGIRAVAKATGTLPRIIDPSGSEIVIKRDQRANIIEQVKLMRYIERYQPEALVVECMAVLPEYQWFCEHKMIHSQIGVLTNCRLDHINEMGRFREQIANSLANTCPTNGTLFTSEKTNLSTLEEAAATRNTKVFRHGGQSVGMEVLKRFGHIEHPANVGLALAVCRAVGVDRETALEGMYRSTPDSGALRVALCRQDGKELLFVNAMAANDPESTLEIWHQIKERFAPLGTIIIMLNSRSDRQDRSIQLIEMIAGHIGETRAKPFSRAKTVAPAAKNGDTGGQSIKFDKIVLTGESPGKYSSYLTRYGIYHDKTLALGMTRPEKAYATLFDLTEKHGTVLGIGNVGAGGLDIFRYFYKRRVVA